jgi:hypothetical protein
MAAASLSFWLMTASLARSQSADAELREAGRATREIARELKRSVRKRSGTPVVGSKSQEASDGRASTSVVCGQLQAASGRSGCIGGQRQLWPKEN